MLLNTCSFCFNKIDLRHIFLQRVGNEVFCDKCWEKEQRLRKKQGVKSCSKCNSPIEPEDTSCSICCEKINEKVSLSSVIRKV